MPVTFTTVTPGIALSAAEANRLRGEISAQVVAMGLNAGINAQIPNFRDDRGNNRRVAYRVLAVNGQNISIALTSMI